MNTPSCPLVTCIITCYKKFEYLYEAISSALVQDYPRIELLITDDGSENFPEPDVTDYIKKHAKENIVRWVVHHHEENQGTVRNINSMLKIAMGDYFIGLDGDDVFYDSTVFSKIVSRFESTGVDLLSCSRLQCTEQLKPVMLLPSEADLEKIRLLDTPQKQFDSFSVFQFINIASGSAMYFSRDNLHKMGMFDENYRNWQDGPRIAEYAKSCGMIPTAFDIISVKYRDGGVSNNPIGNSNSFVHITNDRATFINKVVKTNVFNRNISVRRNILFWYHWDCCRTLIQRLFLMVRFPEKSALILIRKVQGKSIR